MARKWNVDREKIGNDPLSPTPPLPTPDNNVTNQILPANDTVTVWFAENIIKASITNKNNIMWYINAHARDENWLKSAFKKKTLRCNTKRNNTNMNLQTLSHIT